MKNVKKIILSSFVIVMSVGYIFLKNTAQNTSVVDETAGNTPSVSLNEGSSPPTNQPATPKGQYTDGTYVGKSANAYYGNVQVQTEIKNGLLVSVDFLQHPDDRVTSQYINEQAMPSLKSEAIQVQSSDVSGVSGATYTSKAFRESLDDALTQAKNS